MALTIARAGLHDEGSRRLIESLNAELAAAYSEPGANHFQLDPAEVVGNRGAFLVVSLDGRPVGCGAVRMLDDETGELKRMYLAPGVRGKGFGRQLVAALEAEGRRLGVRRLVLETGIRQTAALALYRATGFQDIPLYGEYRQSPKTSVCLGKELTPPHVVRRAREEDWPTLWAIIAAVARTGDTYTLDPDLSEVEGRRHWLGDGMDTYVAEIDGEIVGTYVLRANQKGLGSHVANAGYMVRPGFAGRGIGAALAEHSFAAARAAGFEAMQFNAVVSTNLRAVALWQRLGFVIIGTLPRAFRHQQLGYVDLHIMHRFL